MITKDMQEPPPKRNRKVVAVIPARGGSTRLPDKNMRIFAGRPLVAWSIIQAMNAFAVDEVWVSSDSERILDCAARYGAKPFMRQAPENDDAPGWVPMLEIISRIMGPDDILVGLLPTSPLRAVSDVDDALRKYLTSPNHEEKILNSAYRIHEDFRLEVMNDDLMRILPAAENNQARFNGLIHICTRAYYEKTHRDDEEMYMIPYFIEEWQTGDVNTIDQLDLAELVFYHKVLVDNLNPYALYKKGGIKV